MIDFALTQLLRQVTGLTDRVTPASNSKPVTKDLPRVVYTLIDAGRQYTDSGVMELRTSRYQLDVFAPLRTTAREVIADITARADLEDEEQRGLDGYRGTIHQTQIHRIYFGSERDGQAMAAPGQNTTPARSIIDLIVVYRELPTEATTP